MFELELACLNWSRYKQSPNSYDTFFRRWFVFADGRLSYSKDRTLTAEKVVDLSEIVDVRLEFDDPSLRAILRCFSLFFIVFHCFSLFFTVTFSDRRADNDA